MLLDSNSQQLRKIYCCFKNVFVSLGVLKLSLSMMKEQSWSTGPHLCIHISKSGSGGFGVGWEGLNELERCYLQTVSYSTSTVE